MRFASPKRFAPARPGGAVLALYLYAATLFVSAFILFLVQPLVGKMILPKLGGTPQVWNTCCVFFQMVLLAGYAYTHFISTRLKLRQQLLLHSVMLILPLAVLFGPALFGWPSFFNLYVSVDKGGWNPGHPGANPIPATLYVLFVVIGLPFLVVSTTAPLLQKWFAFTGHPASKDPYFLYGASNLGSLLALIAYPVILEPALNLDTQTYVWAGGYFALIATVLVCVSIVWLPSARTITTGPALTDAVIPPAGEVPPEPGAEASTAVSAAVPQTTKPTGIRPGVKKGPRFGPTGASRAEVEPALVAKSRDEIDIWRRLRWIALAAIPSSLMLGVTTHITTDLSPIPLFWVIPLALYLLTFILVFAKWPIVWTEAAHPYVLFAQPVCIVLMIMADMLPSTDVGVVGSIFFNMLGFFATTLVCHGELAKDRPSTRYLTEFYLWMSVGGMVGGMFNALFAPLVFKTLAELGIAIFAACLIRPRMKDSGWTDELVAGLLEPAPEAPAPGPRGAKGPRPQASIAKPGATSQMVLALDFILPGLVMLLSVALAFVVTDWVAALGGLFLPRSASDEEARRLQILLTFGLPLVIACFYYGRPLRFGLAIGAVMLIHSLFLSNRDSSEYNDRSFFGIIAVKQSAQKMADGTVVSYRQLIHGHINHGMNFIQPKEEQERGKPDKDYSRLATTYYHRLGPAGRVMELFNWFKDPRENVYPADARMPAAIVGNLMGDLAGSATLPASSFTNLWSEPPFATIGLGTGTMASYGRPYQHVHYYEIDNHIRRLSLPGKSYYTFEEPEATKAVGVGKNSAPYFTYLDHAIRRGCDVQVLMGDARLRMALPYGSFAKYNNNLVEYTALNEAEQKKILALPEAERKKYVEEYPVPPGGPEDFYHMMVVDAFSSDAIPAHLITKEAIKMYFGRLSEQGILCVHTSNRFVSLPRVVAAVAAALNDELTPDEQARNINYACIRGHDVSPYEPAKIGHFTSEWVMVARKAEYLQRVKDMKPKDYDEAARKKAAKQGSSAEPYWNTPVPNSRYLWTDNYYTLWTVLRRAGDRD
jgi:hypothetical protein